MASQFQIDISQQLEHASRPFRNAEYRFNEKFSDFVQTVTNYLQMISEAPHQYDPYDIYLVLKDLAQIFTQKNRPDLAKTVIDKLDSLVLRWERESDPEKHLYMWYHCYVDNEYVKAGYLSLAIDRMQQRMNWMRPHAEYDYDFQNILHYMTSCTRHLKRKLEESEKESEMFMSMLNRLA